MYEKISRTNLVSADVFGLCITVQYLKDQCSIRDNMCTVAASRSNRFYITTGDLLLVLILS